MGRALLSRPAFPPRTALPPVRMHETRYAFVLNEPQAIITIGSHELGRKEKLFALVPGTILIFLLSGAYEREVRRTAAAVKV